MSTAVAEKYVILVVAEHQATATETAAALQRHGYATLTASDAASAAGLLQRHHVDTVIIPPGERARAYDRILARVRQGFPDVPVMDIASLLEREPRAGRTRAGGALDSREWDLVVAELALVLARWEPQRQQRLSLNSQGAHLKGLIGRSAVMKQLFAQVSRIATSRAPVLIMGETGTGKDVIAQAIHRASGLHPMVPVNCGAIPRALLESELFGHVRGAFTGAHRDKAGLFEDADGGTLFLDEIAELPLDLQAKLLRALQFGEIRRVGDVATRHVSVRLIAATNRDLATAVREGLFREDLLYRINVLQLTVPPLRERPSDIPLLAEFILSRIRMRNGVVPTRFTAAALARLVAYHWPGNIRQLENLLERAAIFGNDEALGVSDLPEELHGGASASGLNLYVGAPVTLAEVERVHILAVLDRTGGNRSEAARILGLPRRTLYRRLHEYGLMAGTPRDDVSPPVSGLPGHRQGRRHLLRHSGTT